MLLPHVGFPDGAAKTAERMISALGEPFSIGGYEISIGTSIGITMADAHCGDVDELLRSADLAMYRAKQEDRVRFRFFEPEMNQKIRERRELEQGLRTALEEEGFPQPVHSHSIMWRRRGGNIDRWTVGYPPHWGVTAGSTDGIIRCNSDACP